MPLDSENHKHNLITPSFLPMKYYSTRSKTPLKVQAYINAHYTASKQFNECWGTESNQSSK